MSEGQKRLVETNIRAVAALAEVLADEVKLNRLWEGDLENKIGRLQEFLNSARSAAKRKDL